MKELNKKCLSERIKQKVLKIVFTRKRGFRCHFGLDEDSIVPKTFSRRHKNIVDNAFESLDNVLSPEKTFMQKK